MKKTPFFSLFKCLHLRAVDSSDCRRVDSVSIEIMRRFKPTVRKFGLGGLDVGITKQDVRLIFGIVDGDRPIEKAKLGMKKQWRFCNRVFRGCKKLNQKLIKEKIDIVFGRANKNPQPDDVEDGVRLICLLAIASVFFPQNGVTLPWGWVEYVENLDNMRSYDWSGRIMSMLVDSLVKSHGTPYKVKGCTILPLYWLCEHAQIIPMRDDTRADGGMIPRLVKWHLPKLKDTVVKDICSDKVNVNELVATKGEVSWYAKMSKCKGHTDSDFVDDEDDDNDKEIDDFEESDAGDSEAMSVDLSADHDYMSFGDTDNVEADCGNVAMENGREQMETEVREAKKMYDDLLTKHDKLQKRFGEIEDENSRLREEVRDINEKISCAHAVPLSLVAPVLDGENLPYEELARRWKECKKEINRKDGDLWKLNDRVSLLNATITQLLEESNLKDKNFEKARERVAELEEKLEKKNNIRRVDLDEERWHNEFVEQQVHEITQAFSPNINVGAVEKAPKPNSMVRRIKDKIRKPTNKGDDFVFVGVPSKRKRGDVGSSRSKGSTLTVDEFLSLMDRKYKSHCARYIKPKCLQDFVDKYNSPMDETVYHSRKPLVVVPVSHIMHILRGVYISNSIIDAYGAHLLKVYKGELNITIMGGHCWSIIMEKQHERFFEEIDSAIVKEKALVLFPILSTGKTVGVGAEHWTLLVYDVYQSVWTFYNSMRPRTGRRDKYLEDAKKMKDILEKRWSESTDAQFQLLTQTQIPLISMTGVPSQGATNDCAIYTCYFMKSVVMDTIVDVDLGSTALQRLKAEIIEAIVSPS